MLKLAKAEGQSGGVPVNYGKNGTAGDKTKFKRENDSHDMAIIKQILGTLGTREMTPTDVSNRLGMNLEQVKQVMTRMFCDGILRSDHLDSHAIYWVAA
jgi:DNA-directed RNA polymerase specialized sigma subunit